MKNLLKIDGAAALSKADQIAINGGIPTCQVYPCPPGLCCHPKGHCYYNPSCIDSDG